MRTKFFTLSMIALMAVTSISCSKDEPTPTPPAVVTTVAGEGITWSINGQATTRNIAGRYGLSGVGSNELNVFAQTNPNNIFFEINFVSKTPGTYQIGNGNGLYYSFSANESLTTVTSGTLTLISFINNKASGTFTATGTGVGVTSISGSFNNLSSQ